jgi:hypothetical protein
MVNLRCNIFYEFLIFPNFSLLQISPERQNPLKKHLFEIAEGLEFFF